MMIKTTLTLTGGDVRILAIRNNWCGCCDNDEYAAMLNRCDGVHTEDSILEIAETIADYSDYKAWERSTFGDYVEFVEDIAFKLLNDACSIIVEVTK